jgi:hypothetical protein
MRKYMTPLERCAILGHPWQRTACPGWFLCSRCGAVRAPGQVAISSFREKGHPMSSPEAPSPQRGGRA